MNPNPNLRGIVVLAILIILCITLAILAVGSYIDLGTTQYDLDVATLRLEQYQLSYTAMDVALGERDRLLEGKDNIIDEVIGDLNRCRQELWELENK